MKQLTKFNSKDTLVAIKLLTRAKERLEQAETPYVCCALSYDDGCEELRAVSRSLRSDIALALAGCQTVGGWLKLRYPTHLKAPFFPVAKDYRLAWIDSMIQNIHDTGTIFTAAKLQEINNANA